MEAGSSGFRAWEAQKPAELSDVSATERCASRKELPAGFPWPGLEVLKHRCSCSWSWLRSCSPVHVFPSRCAVSCLSQRRLSGYGGGAGPCFSQLLSWAFLCGQKHRAWAASHGREAGTGHKQCTISTWAKVPCVHPHHKHVTLPHPHTMSAPITTHTETHTLLFQIPAGLRVLTT